VTKTSHPVDALVRAALYGGAQRYLADEQDPTSCNAHRDMTARRADNNNNNHRFTAIIKVTQPAKNWRILLVRSFAARMPLLTATSAFGLGRRRWNSPQ